MNNAGELQEIAELKQRLAELQLPEKKFHSRNKMEFSKIKIIKFRR
jgi:hypothetical protein